MALQTCMPQPPEGLDTKSVARDIQYRKLKRITEPEIMEAALKEGILLQEDIEKKFKNPQNGAIAYQNTDTLFKTAAKVFFWAAYSQAMLPEEKALWEAYKTIDFRQETASENLQKLKSTDLLLLYTFPLVADDSAQMRGFWAIQISKQDLLKKYFWTIPKGFRKK